MPEVILNYNTQTKLSYKGYGLPGANLKSVLLIVMLENAAVSNTTAVLPNLRIHVHL